MFIKQISIKVPNVAGRLQDISQVLGGERLNIRAILVASADDVSTVRFVVDDPVKAMHVLESQGYSPVESDVIAVEVPDHPGGLQAILKPLKRANINIHYLYSHLGRGESGNPIIIVGMDKTSEAIEVLKDNWVQIYGKEAYSL